MRRGRIFQAQRILQRPLNRLRGRLHHAEPLLETVLRVRFHQLDHGPLLPALRRVNLHLAPAPFGQKLLQNLAIFEFDRHVNQRRNVRIVQIDLLQQRSEKLRRLELRLIFPEELPPVDDAAAAQVKQIHRDQRRLGVISKDVGIVAFRRGHLLLLAHFFHGVQQIVQSRRLFVAHFRAKGLDATAQFPSQILMPAFQKQPHRPHRFGVCGIRRKSFDARTQAAMNVKFQARMRVLARQIDVARRHFEVAMNEVHQPVRQISRKIRTVIGRTVFFQTASHVHARIGSFVSLM